MGQRELWDAEAATFDDEPDHGLRFTVGDASAPALPESAYDVVLARLVLVEGRWHTGAGLGAADAERIVRTRRQQAEVTRLDDPVYWGGEITDERYLLVSLR